MYTDTVYSTPPSNSPPPTDSNPTNADTSSGENPTSSSGNISGDGENPHRLFPIIITDDNDVAGRKYLITLHVTIATNIHSVASSFTPLNKRKRKNHSSYVQGDNDYEDDDDDEDDDEDEDEEEEDDGTLPPAKKAKKGMGKGKAAMTKVSRDSSKPKNKGGRPRKLAVGERSEWYPGKCKQLLGLDNGHLSRTYKRWRQECLGKALELGIATKTQAGMALWQQLEDFAYNHPAVLWSSAGAELVDDNTEDTHLREIGKAVTDLLKDVVKKHNEQWIICLKEATAAGIDPETAGIRQRSESPMQGKLYAS